MVHQHPAPHHARRPDHHPAMLPYHTMTKADHGYLTNVRGITGSGKASREVRDAASMTPTASPPLPTFDQMEGLESLVVLGWRPAAS